VTGIPSKKRESVDEWLHSRPSGRSMLSSERRLEKSETYSF
jgi:hypothetical protein